MATPTSISTRTLAGIPTRMSSFSLYTPSNTAYTTNSSDGNGGSGLNGGGGTGGTLYLFTFLTTLLLLLAVSCGIVIRSFILRRRFHRRVEEAIAAGVLLPSQTGDIGMGPGGTINVFRRHIGEKPKMWEVWIDERSFGDKYASLSGEWTKIQPFAATQISDTLPNPKPDHVEEAPITPASTSLFGRIASRLPVRRATRRGPAPINSMAATPEVPLSTLAHGSSTGAGRHPNDGPRHPLNDKEGSIVESNRSVQVAVLIAMPDPLRARYSSGGSSTDDSHGENGGVKGKQRSLELPSISMEEHELPEICIGITHAQMMRDVSPAVQAPNAPKL